MYFKDDQRCRTACRTAECFLTDRKKWIVCHVGEKKLVLVAVHVFTVAVKAMIGWLVRLVRLVRLDGMDGRCLNTLYSRIIWEYRGERAEEIGLYARAWRRTVASYIQNHSRIDYMRSTYIHAWPEARVHRMLAVARGGEIHTYVFVYVCTIQVHM